MRNNTFFFVCNVHTLICSNSLCGLEIEDFCLLKTEAVGSSVTVIHSYQSTTTPYITAMTVSNLTIRQKCCKYMEQNCLSLLEEVCGISCGSCRSPIATGQVSKFIFYDFVRCKCFVVLKVHYIHMQKTWLVIHISLVCCFTVEIHSILLYVHIYKYMQVYDRVMQMGGDLWHSIKCVFIIYRHGK